ncbi:hypothetical protein RSSM_01002 [Rhodopirellula sallentina SM41]|uniref:Uncharacterized protein n=1 Tax=Rhodopirellula sallentina SM41 TaxID=1263870 RepID=M5UI73_9BACT|nr:hypothetical protein RSSM_01002 [Rhodopirellula sallentina SM41]
MILLDELGGYRGTRWAAAEHDEIEMMFGHGTDISKKRMPKMNLPKDVAKKTAGWR